MGTPKGNGLVEITGENKAMDKGWFCMDLMRFLRGVDWETFHSAFQQAKSGNCPYRKQCPRYAKTISKTQNQLSIQFNE